MQVAQVVHRTYSLEGELWSCQTGQDIEESPTHGCNCTGRVELGAFGSSSTDQRCSSPFFSVTHIGSVLLAAVVVADGGGGGGGDDQWESLTILLPNLSH